MKNESNVSALNRTQQMQIHSSTQPALASFVHIRNVCNANAPSGKLIEQVA